MFYRYSGETFYNVDVVNYRDESLTGEVTLHEAARIVEDFFSGSELRLRGKLRRM